ncbi:putative C2H2 type zinc finger domain protein [Pseudohyphozyma bogoriensis]|nr:putative C2H2 type zinc finger domain protein [Pseudohyphozyma bogoriensis]
MATAPHPTSSTPRPANFTCAAPDGTVLLSGRLKDGGDDFGAGKEFVLDDEDGIWVAHPSLLSLAPTPPSPTPSSSSPTDEPAPPTLTLTSILSSKPLFKLETPSSKTIILLTPFLAPSGFATLDSLPAFSPTLQLLIDGPDYPPPRFHFDESKEDSQGWAASPLLAPTGMRRRVSVAAESAEKVDKGRIEREVKEDEEIEKLELGDSRAEEGKEEEEGLHFARSKSRSRAAAAGKESEKEGLEKLLATNGGKVRDQVDKVVMEDGKRAAEEIMAVRRKHDLLLRRTAEELRVIEARIAAFGTYQVHVSTPSGNHSLSPSRTTTTKIVKGFAGSSPSPHRGTPEDEEELRERAALKVRRGSAGKREVTDEKDREASREVEREREKEEEGRGRSQTRSTSRGGRSSSRGLEEEVKRVVDASRERSRNGRGGNGSQNGRDKKEIQATVDDSKETEAAARKERDKEREKEKERERRASLKSPAFMPASSKGLVPIGEEDEMTLEERIEKGLENGAEAHAKPIEIPGNGTDQNDDSTDLDGEGFFPLDEDVDHGDHSGPHARVPSPHREPSPPARSPEAAYSPPTSMSYRRPSVLSSSYANLLSQSMRSRTPQTVPLSAYVSSSPSEPHPTQTTAREDIAIAAANRSNMSDDTRKQAFGTDAPSHRPLLPMKRSSGKARPSTPDEEEDEYADEEENGRGNVPPAFVVGSLPINIGPRTPLVPAGGMGNAKKEERELMRKTSVPAREEGMWVPPLPKRGRKKSVAKPNPPSSSSYATSTITEGAAFEMPPSSFVGSTHYRAFHSFTCHQTPIETEWGRSKGKNREMELREGECGRVFPDEGLLEVHMVECHDPLTAVRQEKGDKVFKCLTPECSSYFSTPKTRRNHLISKHGFPKQYFFAVTVWGVGDILRKGGGLVRRDWKPRDDGAPRGSGSGSEGSFGGSVSPEVQLVELPKVEPEPTVVDGGVDELTKALEGTSIGLVPRAVRKKMESAKKKGSGAVEPPNMLTTTSSSSSTALGLTTIRRRTPNSTPVLGDDEQIGSPSVYSPEVGDGGIRLVEDGDESETEGEIIRFGESGLEKKDDGTINEEEGAQRKAPSIRLVDSPGLDSDSETDSPLTPPDGSYALERSTSVFFTIVTVLVSSVASDRLTQKWPERWYVSEMAGNGQEDKEGSLRVEDEGRLPSWTKEKWALLVSVSWLFVYGMVGLWFSLATWFQSMRA